MNITIKILASMVCALPFAALAQTSTPSSTDKTGTAPPAGMESKKTTETGQSTTFPKSDASPGMKESETATDKDKNKITKGGAKSPTSPMKQLDPSTTEKPAKEGSQSGPTK